MLSLKIIRKFKDLCAWLGVAAIIIDMYKHFQRFGMQTNKMHNNLDSAWAARLSVNIISFGSFLKLEFNRNFKDQCAWLGVAAIIIDMYKHFQRFGTQTNKMHNNLDSAWAARLSVNIIIFFFILHF